MSKPITIITEILKDSISTISQNYNIAVESLKYNIITESVTGTVSNAGIGVMRIGTTFIVG